AAIAALAYGTKTIPKVDKIVGPGNEYVTEAKRLVYGAVGIDGLAGPSEIAVWVDSSCVPARIAWNLLAQAEHGPQSVSCLYSMDETVLLQIQNRIPNEFKKQMRFFFSKNEETILTQINQAAPEHLLLAIRNPRKVLKKIRGAGAIFLGGESPVALGDYIAGPSHVLPTNGTGRFSSGLSVKDFLRWSSVIENKSKNKKLFRMAQVLAETEKLHYHSLSLRD
ncbi:MAG: histidinol dehydrogenase, partial [Elusimicrobia bacterium]|nr:histidinol dehydrogenase [Elusimicrobiota bacterium]